MKYAVSRAGTEECFLTRDIELGVQLVLDSMIAVWDVGFYSDTVKTLSIQVLSVFSICNTLNNSGYSYFLGIYETGSKASLRLVFLTLLQCLNLAKD